jgi:hypothetical protein
VIIPDYRFGGWACWLANDVRRNLIDGTTIGSAFLEMGGMMMNGGTKQMLAYSLTMMLLSPASLALAQTSATPPNSAGGGQPASGDDATYCRPPQQRTDSRMMGPKVCMSVGKWKELRAKGKDVAADGSTIVPMQNGTGLTGTP